MSKSNKSTDIECKYCFKSFTHDNGVDIICLSCGTCIDKSLGKASYVEPVISNSIAYCRYEGLTIEEAKIINSADWRLQNICSKLFILDNVFIEAMDMFKLIIVENEKRKQRDVKMWTEWQSKIKFLAKDYYHVSIACLCASIKRNSCGVRHDEIIFYCGKPIGCRCLEIYEDLCDYFVIAELEPEWYIERFSKSFGFQGNFCRITRKRECFELEKKALMFIKKTKDTLEDNRAYSVATLAIYIASHVIGKPIELPEIKRVTGVVDITIKNLYNKVKSQLKDIFPENSNIQNLFKPVPKKKAKVNRSAKY